MSNLLVIDDDRSVHCMVSEAFQQSPVEVWAARNVEEGLQMVKRGPDLVLLDIVMPDVSGLEAARQIHALDPKLPMIFITGRGTSDTAIEAMKLGAYDYLLKPLDLPKLRELVSRALEIRRLMNVPVQWPREEHIAPAGDQLVGRSPEMQEVYKAIGRVAPQNVTVLIHVESGTGKELVARSIYHHSDRAEGKFLAVNCAALPEALLESEVVGRYKGSVTSADQRRIGKFEQCNGGTIFLDEVGDMSPLVQSKVLRVLQEQKFERVGGSQTIQTDVRIITATNRDLKKMVADGDFREDLYYRLNGFAIEVPPLRERGDDVLLLLQHCLERFNRELGKDVHGIAPEALDLLIRYSWPGNVRELEAVVRQSLLQTTGSVILPEFLPDFVREEKSAESFGESSDHTESDLQGWVETRLRNQSHDVYREIIQLTERYLLTMVLRATAGNQSQAAKLLGITRGSLRSKIRALGISLGASVTVNGTADAEAEEADAQAEESSV